MSYFSDNLKRLRLSKNMTQGDLAEKIYASVQSISRWENGESEPSIDMISQISTFFGVSTDKLIRNNDMSESEILSIVSDYIATDDDFSDKSFKLCRGILDGRLKRRSEEARFEISLDEKYYYIITNRNGFDGVFANKDQYPPLFAITNTKKLSINNIDIEKIQKVFSILSVSENIPIILKAQSTDGWYDEASIIKHFGIPAEALASVLEMFSELGMLYLNELAINGTVKKVYSIHFDYKVKLLLSITATCFSQNKASFMW